MPNPYHFRAHIDRLWRRSGDHNPGYIRIKALNAVVRELFAPNDRARRNYQLYLATDPYDVARHLLRNLHDRPGPMRSSPPKAPSAPLSLWERAGVRVPLPSRRKRPSRTTTTPRNRRFSLFSPRVFFFSRITRPRPRRARCLDCCA